MCDILVRRSLEIVRLLFKIRDLWTVWSHCDFVASFKLLLKLIMVCTLYRSEAYLRLSGFQKSIRSESMDTRPLSIGGYYRINFKL